MFCTVKDIQSTQDQRSWKTAALCCVYKPFNTSQSIFMLLAHMIFKLSCRVSNIVSVLPTSGRLIPESYQPQLEFSQLTFCFFLLYLRAFLLLFFGIGSYWTRGTACPSISEVGGWGWCPELGLLHDVKRRFLKAWSWERVCNKRWRTSGVDWLDFSSPQFGPGFTFSFPFWVLY